MKCKNCPAYEWQGNKCLLKNKVEQMTQGNGCRKHSVTIFRDYKKSISRNKTESKPISINVGIMLDKDKKYEAISYFNNTYYHLGIFNDMNDAREAYNNFIKNNKINLLLI